MKAIIKKTLGKVDYTFEIEGQRGFDVLSIAGFLSSMPDTCKICGSKNVHLTSNKAKGYTFVKVLCEDCNARAQLGQYKDGGYFWKEWEEYNPPQTAVQPEQPDSPEPPQPEVNPEQIF